MSWRDEAACVVKDPELWFADESTRNSDVADARRICAGCPVAAECLADTPKSDKWSIRGGLTARQRRSRRAAA